MVIINQQENSQGLLSISGKIRRDGPIRRPGFLLSYRLSYTVLSGVGRIQGDLTAMEQRWGPNDTRVAPRDSVYRNRLFSAALKDFSVGT